MANQTAAAIDENAIAPDTGKPMTKTETWRFMIGFIIFGIMWMMSGTIGSNVLFPERFNGLNIGQPEAILAAMNSVGSIFALFSNLVFGALSDHCHSRFGKRTPFIVLGGFICGCAFWSTSVATHTSHDRRLLVRAADWPQLHACPCCCRAFRPHPA